VADTEPCLVRPGAYHPGVVLGAGTAVIDAVILVSSIVPVLAMIVFARWFLRAGKRYDERERAARRRPLD
jgi:hypothetical protein